MSGLILSEMPVADLAAELAKLLQEASQPAAGLPVRRRAPALTVEQGARNVARALTRYENAAGSRDEKPALASLVAASKGLRKALQDEKHPLKTKD
ncbi:hypothetical protein [Sinorhizobium medicae]|uniref:hypothetical protein n=1 Tax=Sinorhizobium medicae TaxID=110321 RepID=UPI00040EAC6C|nr:hypothetical protein [Sinorhizobium medicae]RVQ76139.1 hypothetical protein CN244_06425 [Sinorhizobium medicae]